MIYTKKINSRVYLIRASEFNDLNFHGATIKTEMGSSYNSYLIIDEKITLVDTMDEPLAKEFITTLEKLLDGRTIDNIIINHVEPDHSGSYEEVLKLAPNAKTYCSAKAETAMKHLFFQEHEYEVVDHLSELDCGNYTLQFIHTPFIHWPDNMFTYLKEDKILFSNDGFGSLLSGTKIYDDQYSKFELEDAAKLYYANIVLPCSRYVKKKLAELDSLNLEFNLICPSHGIIYRSYISEIIDLYKQYCNHTIKPKKVVMIYESIWGSTDTCTRELASVLVEKDYDVQVFKASVHNPSLIMKELMDAEYLFIGSSNFNNTYPGPIADIIERIIALKPQNKKFLVYGSYGWAHVHLKKIEEQLSSLSYTEIEQPIYGQYRPDKARKEYIKSIVNNLE